MTRLLLMVVLSCRGPAPSTTATTAAAPVEAPVSETVLDHIVWTDPGVDASQALPLLIVMHGLGDSPEGILGLYKGLGRVRVVSARGPTPYGTGASWFSSGATQVPASQIAEEMRNRAGEVVQLIAWSRTAYPTSGPVVVSGFSQGAMMSMAVALIHPESIDGAVPVAAYVPAPLVPEVLSAALKATPIRALHGTADPVLPFHAMEEVVLQLKARGADIEFDTFDGVEHNIPALMRSRVHARLRALLLSSVDRSGQGR